MTEGVGVGYMYLGNGVAHELEEDLPQRHAASFFLKGVCPCQGVGWGALLEHAPECMQSTVLNKLSVETPTLACVGCKVLIH